MEKIIKYKKPLLFIAVALIVVEVIWGFYTLNRPLPDSQSLPAVEETPKAIFSLKGPTTTTTGGNFTVEVELSTTSPSQGADLVVKYDPKVLELVKDQENAATVGKVFQDYPENSVDANGVITISGVTATTGYTGTGVFATLNFKALSKGKTQVTIDYKKGSTTDSNVTEAESISDILGKVNNLEVSIN